MTLLQPFILKLNTHRGLGQLDASQVCHNKANVHPSVILYSCKLSRGKIICFCSCDMSQEY